MTEVVYATASTDEDLEQILALQRANVEASLRPEDAAREGFVTLRHDLEILRDMSRADAQIVARSNGRIVGYALVMALEFGDRFPVLDSLFAELERLAYRDRPVQAYRHFVMGQVCIDRDHRGKGIFDGMYAKMKELHEERYELVVTEAASRNVRSIRAHERVGFETLHRYEADGEEWSLIVWDWRPE